MIEGLKDKVVIVTGGGHGIGKAYCLGFGRSGSRVVVADIDRPAADKVSAEIVQQTGAHALALHTDVADERSTKGMADVVLQRFGRIDVLINNAAIFATIPMNRGRIETIDPAEWDRLMAVNLKGLFFCCRAVLPSMRAQKSGKIINIASGTVFAGSPGRIHYVTSKTATIGFTRTLAREVGDDKINVNGGADQTVTFTNTAGAGNVSTIAEFNTWLEITGVGATVDAMPRNRRWLSSRAGSASIAIIVNSVAASMLFAAAAFSACA